MIKHQLINEQCAFVPTFLYKHTNHMSSQDNHIEKDNRSMMSEKNASDDKKMESDRRRLQRWRVLIGIKEEKNKCGKTGMETMLIASTSRSKEEWTVRNECVRVCLYHLNRGTLHCTEANSKEREFFPSTSITCTFLWKSINAQHKILKYDFTSQL